MRAAVRSKYGLPEVLRIAEVETPTPGANEVLVRIRTATANRSDYHVLTGRPLAMRLFTGLLKPRQPTTGTDFAGEVEAVGAKVETFKVGDRVIGFGGPFGAGSHAEYLSFPEDKGIVAMPERFDYVEAASFIEGAAYAASTFVRVQVRKGEKALVNGATGAIGSAYVQLFAHFGAHVTAVCRKKHFELVRALGAERCIDYETDDFMDDDETYDYVFDPMGKSSFSRCKRLLNESGVYSGNNLRDFLRALLTFRSKGKRVLLTRPPDIKEVLQFVTGIVERGGFRPVIDRTYPLEGIADAFRFVATGEKVGSVVLTIDTQDPQESVW